MISVVLAFSNAARREFIAAWTAYAKAKGMQLEVGQSFPSRPTTMTGAIENVPITFDHFTVSNGKSSTSYTRVTARAIEPVQFSLSVYYEGFFSSLGKMLGTQDIVVGNEPFDKAFMVKTNDEHAARALLDASTCQSLLGFPHDSLSLSYEDGTVKMTWVGLESQHAVLDAAARVMVAICRWRRPEQSLR